MFKHVVGRDDKLRHLRGRFMSSSSTTDEMDRKIKEIEVGSLPQFL